MRRCFPIAFLMALGGCGSTLGSFDDAPAGPDVSAAEWPLLVDTPEPPEGRLTAGNGDRAVQRLAEQRVVVDRRRVQADTVAPVSEVLVSRGQTSLSRTDDGGPGFDADDLLARAARLREKRLEPAPTVSSDLALRSATARERNSVAEPSVVAVRRPVPLRPLESPVVSVSFEERARRAQQRAAQAGG